MLVGIDRGCEAWNPDLDLGIFQEHIGSKLHEEVRAGRIRRRSSLVAR